MRRSGSPKAGAHCVGARGPAEPGVQAAPGEQSSGSSCSSGMCCTGSPGASSSSASMECPAKPDVPADPQRELLAAELQRLCGSGEGPVERRQLAKALCHRDPAFGTEEHMEELLRHVNGSHDGTPDIGELVSWILGSTGGAEIHAVLQLGLQRTPAEVEDKSITEIERAAATVEAAIAPLLGDKGRQSGSDNFHCILEDKLYLGGSGPDANELRKVGITHVVRILEDEAPSVLPPRELRGSLFVQAADVRTHDLRPHFREVCSFIGSALESGGRAYVHCAMGRSRSCTMVLVYLVLGAGMPLLDAWIHVLRRRDVMAINIGFLAQLAELDEEVHGKLSLPLLSAFIVKVRKNRYVAADTSRTFDVAELLEWWRSPDARGRRQAGMANAMAKVSMAELRQAVEGRVEKGSPLKPLQSRCYEATRAWIEERLPAGELQGAGSS